MDLVDCVLTRKSVRVYKTTPVPKELLTKILDEARRCASTANTQPWEFAVFGGQVMEEMRKAYRERFLSGATPNPDLPYDARAWREPYLSRRRAVGRSLRRSFGIDPDNEEQL